MIESVRSRASAARLPGKVREIAWPNWRVTIAVTAERLNDIGLASIFTISKSLRRCFDQLEHTFLNDIFLHADQSSSENSAKWIYDTMAGSSNDDL
jgi:6-pyruvoyl-tetrahydropterin synthase